MSISYFKVPNIEERINQNSRSKKVYHRGAQFLLLAESIFGRTTVLDILKAFVKTHSYGNVVTVDLLDLFKTSQLKTAYGDTVVDNFQRFSRHILQESNNLYPTILVEAHGNLGWSIELPQNISKDYLQYIPLDLKCADWRESKVLVFVVW